MQTRTYRVALWRVVTAPFDVSLHLTVMSEQPPQPLELVQEVMLMYEIPFVEAAAVAVPDGGVIARFHNVSCDLSGPVLKH